jgi:post-segregation antitoxin (ccd killing protein)
MDWNNLGESLAKLGLPLLGAALPIPGGAALGAALASCIGVPSGKPDDILAKLTQNGELVEKAREFELSHQERILDLTTKYEIAQRQADSSDLSAVNLTMQEELKNSATESWYQKSWRPFNGFVVGLGSLIGVVFTCYLFYLSIVLKDTMALTVVPQLAMSIAAILAVPGAAVGITAWHRGLLQRSEVNKTNT